MVKISKKIALTLLCGAFFANVSADSFLSKLINDYPFAVPYCCAAMGVFSYAQGMRALYFQQVDAMREQWKKDDLRRFIRDKNIEEVEKIVANQLRFYYDQRLLAVKGDIHGNKRGKPQEVKPIKFDVEQYVNKLTPKDYIIHSTQQARHWQFPGEEILAHKVTYWQLPPPMKKNENNEWERHDSTFYQAASDKKVKKSWLPAFCFGVSALNFASAIGFAIYSFSKKA